MTSQELDEITAALEKTLSERYDNLLVEQGKWQQLYDDTKDRADLLWRRLQQLTTSNKKLKNQLAKAKEKVLRLDDTLGCLIEIIAAARQISPDVSDRIDNIIDDVNPLLRDKI